MRYSKGTLIEAKASYKNISSVIDYQCKDCEKNICAADEKYLIGTWNKFRVPFIFATNGRGYTAQLETMSGIWFQDLRKTYNAPKALRGWISPNGILEMLEKNLSAGNEKLHKLPSDLLSKLIVEGIHYKQGDNIAIYDPQRAKLPTVNCWRTN